MRLLAVIVMVIACGCASGPEEREQELIRQGQADWERVWIQANDFRGFAVMPFVALAKAMEYEVYFQLGAVTDREIRVRSGQEVSLKHLAGVLGPVHIRIDPAGKTILVAPMEMPEPPAEPEPAVDAQPKGSVVYF